MRIIHTADIHLDTCFAAAGMPAGFGNRRRQGLRDSFHTLLERAASWPADAVLIAGDLFEHDRVTRDTVAFLRREFAAIQPIPVFIAPGNHDPYVPGSPYLTEAWPDNVVIFRTPEWKSQALEDKPLTVHGFAFDGPDISSNPFGRLQVPSDGRLHIAVAHGSERSRQPASKAAYAPFHAADAATEGLAYLALGHFHAVTPIEGNFGTRMYYSGAPEGHGFGEQGVHCYLEVELEKGRVLVNAVPSSGTVYATYELDCTDFSTSQEIVEAIRALAQESQVNQIARITLTGTCTPALQCGLAGVRDAVSPLFEHLELNDATRLQEDFDELARDNTSLGAFIRTLNELIASAADERERRIRERAREVGLAAYRGEELSIRGLRGGAR
ncbi:MAG: metallophosphoesterase [FCB group bacterium]|jgi:DNA repair exonuclease SbcCD nuclease subunit|nr:metallophosphoesterase [FCB group bacterium]